MGLDKKKFDSEKKSRQKEKTNNRLEAQKKLLQEIPENAFGIYRGDQISQLSTKKVNFNFAQYEVRVPKPHSMLDKYYVDVWEDDETLRHIYGISKKFNLENQDDQQLEITDLFVRLLKQLATKYGPTKHDLEVKALLLTNVLQPNKIQTNLRYKYIHEKMEDKYTSLYGKKAFNPLMLRQITPSHKGFGAIWVFSRGDIQSISIGCSRINEEKETYKKISALPYIDKETKLFGNIGIYVRYIFRFNLDDIKQRIDKKIQKDIFERNGNRDDWDAL